MTIPILIGLAGLGMLGVERWVPGRRWPRVPGWWTRALALTAVQVAIVFAAGRAWDGWMLSQRPAWSFDETLTGALAGYLAITFVYYWWHRARHASDLLWRWLHQLHHSPQRLEVVASFYKHPLEIVANGLLSSAILYLAVGTSAQAAAVAVAATGLAELFYHWNVRTPHWLGFWFQRPESHCVHHEEGRHAGNYADLPLWDWLFGTLDNPRDWRGRCGFGPGREERIGAMLLGRDVSGLGAGGGR
jgi:sterol desaturase/sphingolipid hydroxylase (fatty acid hydroxylase superfamily)